MIKENKKKLILTSILILLPIIAGIFLWNKLPDQMATHWDGKGVANGWSGKGFVVFGLPFFLFGMHWLCLLVSSADPKRKNYSGKLLNMVFWICPIISIFASVVVYGTVFGMKFEANKWIPVFMGIVFIIIGNYLPKCKQNYTMGIKLPWTLNDEDNWNYTHRLAGKVWVIGGTILLLCIFLPVDIQEVALVILCVGLIGIPTVYSYLFYKKKEKLEI